MNVDEAMELFGPSKKKFYTLQSGDHFCAGETLACAVERLRGELADTENARDSWRRVCEKETEAKHQAWTELAAAKAASVCPVKVLNIWEGTYQSDRYIELRTDAEADTFTDWLRERMKDKSPPEA